MTGRVVELSRPGVSLPDPIVVDANVVVTHMEGSYPGQNRAFVYYFIEPDSPHNPDPRYDLDLASFAVVRTYAADADNPYETTGFWEPKEAFGAMAKRYCST